MLIIPAIDIKDGCVVRLVQGKLSAKKIYSKDPLKIARHWRRQGARLIHVVDLDGAYTGRPKNIEIVKKIAEEISVPVQFGGGVRKIETIKRLLAFGVFRVVLGTKAIEDKDFLQKAFKEFKDKVIVSVDAQGRYILTKGWQKKPKGIALSDFIRQLKRVGFKHLIYTDILKDGTLQGPNIRNIKQLLKETGLKIIASGGISSLNDVKSLKKLEKDGLEGVIIGKALYERKFTFSEALKLAAER